MELPGWLREELRRNVGSEVLASYSVGGGMICRAARVEFSQGAVFVKWSEQAASRMFDDERDGLATLRDAGALRVPAVVACGPRPGDPGGGYLVLEFVHASEPRDAPAFGTRFGERLAALHRAPDPGRGLFGYHRDNHLGLLVQANPWRDRWWEFYRDCRVAPQVERARSRGLLHAGLERLLEEVLGSVEALLGEAPHEPALVHGDLWSGNLLCSDGEPVVVDPAVYGAHREVELAYVELFGGFPATWRDAYQSCYPVDAGYVRRRPLLQLYPLLVHLNHFGEQYSPHVEEVCRAALR